MTLSSVDDVEVFDLNLINLTKLFGEFVAVDDLTLTIPAGSFFALLGPSGCGKTTTLRMVAGLEDPTTGQIMLGDKDLTRLKAYKRPVNTVFQSYALFPHLDVFENVAFGLRRRGIKNVSEPVTQMLELVELGPLARRRPGQLSGGQQQRVAVARALINRPGVLLLDEPLGALDLKLRRQMQLELKRIQTEVGTSFVHVTHDQEEAMTTADRMAVLDKGMVQQVGTPDALYDHPVNPFVAGFVGTMNLLPARLGERRADHVMLGIEGVGELPFPAAALAAHAKALAGTTGAVTLSFRPHTVRVALVDAQDDARWLWMPGVVEAREFVGEFTRYRVRVGPHRVAADQAHRAGVSPLAVGAAVRLGLDPTQLRCFGAAVAA